MFDKFGEMNSYTEINELAANLLQEGDLDSLKELAKENGIPPFVIFSNATLADMAKKKPVNLSAFKKVSGVGELKAAWYGKAFVEKIKEYIREHF